MRERGTLSLFPLWKINVFIAYYPHPKSCIYKLNSSIEILHQTTTSPSPICACCMLYLIEILHQTTTYGHSPFLGRPLYLIEILHQTTTSSANTLPLLRCILSKFYIKPQQAGQICLHLRVVSYRNSTSNHNDARSSCGFAGVVSYRNSTSNHNCGCE